MRRLLWLGGFLLFFTPSFTNAGPTEPGCGEYRENGRVLAYCKADGSATVIYYFHGLGGTPSLQKEPIKTLIDGTRRVLGSKAPSVIAISIGKEGVMKTDNIGFVTDSAKKIEALLPMAPSKRVLLGMSMGGHNALRVLMSDPPIYGATALLCPALMDIDLEDPQAKQDYIARHQAYLDRAFFDHAWALWQREFPTRVAWDENNPLTALRRGDFDREPIFLSTGRQDSLGFFEGATVFKTEAERRDVKLTWAPVDGSHCAYDPVKLLTFIVSNL